MFPDESQVASQIPPGLGDRPAQLHAIRHSVEEVDHKTRAIHHDLLASSPHIRAPNFDEIGVVDLQRLFDRYDADLYNGLLSRFLREDQQSQITFRLSKRMTNAAGKASRQRWPAQGPSATTGLRDSYEIAVSTTILFTSFKESGPMKVGGRLCHNRLEALQRTFEHETLHIAEYLAWGISNCSGPNFRRLSLNIFAHEASNHELMTPRLEAAQTLGIRTGDRVSFEFEGLRRTGTVNRVTRRATVLVKDPKGRLYSDGQTYMKFYVPVSSLKKEPPPG